MVEDWNVKLSEGASRTLPTKPKNHKLRPIQGLRAGLSLPALMQLMGHAQIQTTVVYVRITPQDVYQQYVRAVSQLVRPVPPSQL